MSSEPIDWEDWQQIGDGTRWDAYCKQHLTIQRLQAKDASAFQPEPYTEGRDDKWLTLALRMLGYMGRDDVAEGLEAEFEQ